MIYEISHRTSYRYQTQVVQSQHLVHLAPRAFPNQLIHNHGLVVEPAPTGRSDFIDYFGNPTSILTIDDEHRTLIMHAQSTVEVHAREKLDFDATTAWDALSDHQTARNSRPLDLDIVQFAIPSQDTPSLDSIRNYAAPVFTPGRPIMRAAWELTQKIFTEFKFDNSATDVSTPVADVLAAKRGVCQDFAHVALACLRAHRVPARYISGYLRTHPPAGQEALQGVDASHAWISVWAPETGWIDFDPTNNCVTDEEHVAFTYGRGYTDISPISGVLLGGGAHSVDVAVDLRAVPTKAVGTAG